MKLSQLLETVQPMTVEGSLDREITGITYDSRRVCPAICAFPLHAEIPAEGVTLEQLFAGRQIDIREC